MDLVCLAPRLPSSPNRHFVWRVERLSSASYLLLSLCSCLCGRVKQTFNLFKLWVQARSLTNIENNFLSITFLRSIPHPFAISRELLVQFSEDRRALDFAWKHSDGSDSLTEAQGYFSRAWPRPGRDRVGLEFAGGMYQRSCQCGDEILSSGDCFPSRWDVFI